MADWSIMRVSSRTRATDRQEFAGVPDFTKEGRTLAATISGKSAEWRDMRDRFLARMETGDTLIAYSLDRLSRGTLGDSIAVIEGLRDRGIGMRFIDRDCATLSFEAGSEPNEMALAFFAAFARMERRKIAERTKEALAAIRTVHPERLGRKRISAEKLKKAAELYKAGKTHKGIGEVLDITEGSSKSWIMQARKRGFLPPLEQTAPSPKFGSVNPRHGEKKEAAIAARQAGLSLSAAARAAGVSRQTLYAWGVN